MIVVLLRRCYLPAASFLPLERSLRHGWRLLDPNEKPLFVDGGDTASDELEEIEHMNLLRLAYVVLGYVP
jgi:hypothetical protein